VVKPCAGNNAIGMATRHLISWWLCLPMRTSVLEMGPIGNHTALSLGHCGVSPTRRPLRRVGVANATTAKMVRSLLIAISAILLLAACGGSPKPRGVTTPEWHPPSELLEKYADKNGVVTRAAIEAGLKADFAAADKNHDGCLDQDEARTVNEARWNVAASTTSPLIDFFHNGCIDFDEFAAEPRSLFEQLDKNGDGRLTPDELHPGGKAAHQAAP